MRQCTKQRDTKQDATALVQVCWLRCALLCFVASPLVSQTACSRQHTHASSPPIQLLVCPTHLPVDNTATFGLLCTGSCTAPTVARMPTSATPTRSPASNTTAPALQASNNGVVVTWQCWGSVNGRAQVVPPSLWCGNFYTHRQCTVYAVKASAHWQHPSYHRSPTPNTLMPPPTLPHPSFQLTQCLSPQGGCPAQAWLL